MSTVTSPSLGVVQILILGLIHIYRWTLGLLMGGQCRFYPSCSAYGLQAIRRHGASRGSLLTARRVARCHPWNPGGFDPVPEIEQRSRS
jgi:putative membrane protein insertion efficiency factor